MTIDRWWDVVVESRRRGGGPPHTFPSIAAEESFSHRDTYLENLNCRGAGTFPGIVYHMLGAHVCPGPCT